MPRRSCRLVLLLAALVTAAGLAGCAAAVVPARPASPFTSASVSESAPGVFTVSWVAPGARHVSVYAGTDRDRIGRDHAVADGDQAWTREVTGLPPADRWWFEFVPDTGSPLVLADRSLHLAGAPNFRDLGGYRTIDGRWVRMGVLYRSDQLDKLSDTDQAKLSRLGIRTVVDLRTGAERASGPDRLPAGARPVVADVLGGTDTPTDMSALLARPGDPAATMRELERTMVEAPGAQAAYRSLLTEIRRPDRLPLVFHCTAGKDRTGWAAATVLTALGVPGDQVLGDYLESNRYALPKYAPMLTALPLPQSVRAHALLEVRPDYLHAGLDDVAARYRSMDDYTTKVLGVPVDTLRDSLLEGS
ncbi:MAG TPA: tyrosine-protein phosphatase [Pseudonocardia sp.]|nr:tyrosine-protein phosphatase [Pseudonocardia sp.]